MKTFSEFTNEGIPAEGNPGPFLAFGNVGAPYMATLSLPGLTVGLPVWLFSTYVVPNISVTVQLVPPPEQHHVDSKVDLSPYSSVSVSSSSTLPGESLNSSNQVAKKKKKTKKKKSDKREAKAAATASKHILLINLPTLHGKSSSLACCARETIFFEIALAFPRCSKYCPTVARCCP